MDGYEVLTGELDAHAGRVDGLTDRLRTAVDAAQQVTWTTPPTAWSANRSP